jgi:hypothetical protein
MDDDEEHLVMLWIRTVRAVRKRTLKRRELWNTQVIAVGKVHELILAVQAIREACR